jgi:hypothetical protein
LRETRTRVAQTEVEVRFLPETFAVVFHLSPHGHLSQVTGTKRCKYGSETFLLSRKAHACIDLAGGQGGTQRVGRDTIEWLLRKLAESNAATGELMRKLEAVNEVFLRIPTRQDNPTQPQVSRPFYRTGSDDVVLIGYWEAMAMTSQGPLLSTQRRD